MPLSNQLRRRKKRQQFSIYCSHTCTYGNILFRQYFYVHFCSALTHSYRPKTPNEKVKLKIFMQPRCSAVHPISRWCHKTCEMFCNQGRVNIASAERNGKANDVIYIDRINALPIRIFARRCFLISANYNYRVLSSLPRLICVTTSTAQLRLTTWKVFKLNFGRKIHVSPFFLDFSISTKIDVDRGTRRHPPHFLTHVDGLKSESLWVAMVWTVLGEFN